MSNFPLGSDTPDAPWNEPDGPTCEVCGQLGGPRRTCEVCYRKACEGCRKTCDNCGAWTCRDHITEGMCAPCVREEAIK